MQDGGWRCSYKDGRSSGRQFRLSKLSAAMVSLLEPILRFWEGWLS